MLKLTELAPESTESDDAVTLPFDSRQKCRLLGRTDKGREVGIFLPRGQAIKHGFVLKGLDGYNVRVKAAAEALSIVRTDRCIAICPRLLPSRQPPHSLTDYAGRTALSG